MNIRRLVLDVDKALKRPSLIELAQAIDSCEGVEAFNISVEGIDIETVSTIITIEGENLHYDKIAEAIENTGAVVHSIDHVGVGNRLVERIRPWRKGG
jgi:hypothetical protein|uniref:DUF211 domain-containing protein n=1 Tax=Desulfobacca acetoxidans TaxID=60893 RepID=A0A7V6A500_9BACT